MVAYTDPHRADGGGAASAVPLMPSADSSARLCLSVSSGGSEAALAAGSAAGGVTVWDVPTRRVREEWAGQHGGAAVRAVAFAPLRPGWLYSAGDDGRVVLQVRCPGTHCLQCCCSHTAANQRSPNSRVCGAGDAALPCCAVI